MRNVGYKIQISFSLFLLTKISMLQLSPSQSKIPINFATLARDAGIAIVLQIMGIILTYLLEIFLARWMGSTEYGIYKYVLDFAWILGIPAGLGFPLTVLRLISEYKVQESWGLLRGLIRGSWLLTVVASSIICLVGTIVILIINQYHHLSYEIPFLIGIWMILLRALVELQLETSRALDDITLAYAPYQIIWPILVLSSGFFWFKYKHNLNSISIIIMAIVMLSVVVISQLSLLWRKLNQTVETSPPIYANREWLSISLPLLIQGAFTVILFKTDVVMIGLFLGPQQAGIYTSATSTAIWVAFFLQVINTVVAPAFASLNAQKDKEGLQSVVSVAANWVFWPSTITALILFLFSKNILGLFGSEFIVASWDLKILVIGEFVNALCGSMKYLLAMTGYENESAKVFTYAGLINLIFNPIAIILFGTHGAAIITSISLIFLNLRLCVLVIKHLEINPFVFSRRVT